MSTGEGSTTTASGEPTTSGEVTTTSGEVTTTETTGACQPYTIPFGIPLVTPHVMLVIDRSPAMLDGWDHDADPQTPDAPRWASVRRALEEVLPLSAAGHVHLGLAMYPGGAATDDYDGLACAVEPGEFVAPAADNAEAILAALPGADASLVGAAPLGSALAGALALLVDVPPESPRGVVVITHSAPNCSEDAPDLASLLEGLDPAVQATLEDLEQIGLYVGVIAVGAEPGESPVVMDKRPDGVDLAAYLAELHPGASSNPGDEAELVDELMWELVPMPDYSCELMLEPAPGPGQFVAAVRVGGMPVAGPIRDCGSEDGWQWVGDMSDHINLCGAACNLFIETGEIEVDVACEGGGA